MCDLAGAAVCPWKVASALGAKSTFCGLLFPRFLHSLAARMPISKAKQTKRFLKSGQLDNQIQKRRQLKQFKNKVKGRQVKRVHGVPAHQQHNDDDDDEDDLVTKPTKKANHDGSSDSDEDLNVDQVLGAQDMSDEDDDQQQQVSRSCDTCYITETGPLWPVLGTSSAASITRALSLTQTRIVCIYEVCSALLEGKKHSQTLSHLESSRKLIVNQAYSARTSHISALSLRSC